MSGCIPEGYQPIATAPPDGHFRRGDAIMRRTGKSKAPAQLDGRTWHEFPSPRTLPAAPPLSSSPPSSVGRCPVIGTEGS